MTGGYGYWYGMGWLPDGKNGTQSELWPLFPVAANGRNRLFNSSKQILSGRTKLQTRLQS